MCFTEKIIYFAGSLRRPYANVSTRPVPVGVWMSPLIGILAY